MAKLINCLLILLLMEFVDVLVASPVSKRVLEGSGSLEVTAHESNISSELNLEENAHTAAKVWSATKKFLRYRNGHKVKYAKNVDVKGNRSNRDHKDTNVYVVDEITSRRDEDLFEGILEPGPSNAELELLYVRHRLQKLDFYFQFLRVMSEDCRQRILCEVARDPAQFYPLNSVLQDAIGYSDTYEYVTAHLINTTEGARLLSYMEATLRGQDRGRSCAVFQYRCPVRTENMINYDALCLWREMVSWLTIHVVARAV